MIHRRLLQLAGAAPGAILAVAGMGVLVAALHLLVALALAAAVAQIVRGGGDPLLPILTAVGAVAVRGVASWAREVVAAHAGARIRLRLRRRLIARLAAVPAAQRDSGAAAATILDGVDGLDAYFTRYLPQLLVVLIVPGAVVALVAVHVPAAVLPLGIAVVVAVVAPRFWDARLLRDGRERWAQFERLSSDVVEALANLPLLRSFGAGERVGTELTARAERLRAATMSQLRISLLETPLSSLALHLGMIAAVAAAVMALSTGSTTAAATMTVLLLARECFRPMQELTAHWHAGFLGVTAVDGVERLLATRPVVSEEGTHGTPATTGALQLEDVCFRYPGTLTGVSGLRFGVAAGETLALIGPSGSGKSTIARLLEREHDPETGRLLLDGVPLPAYSRAARTRSVVVVPQDPVLFAWSIRDNLRLHRPSASDADLNRAVELAALREVVEALPDGLDTLLAEDGAQLSGGQRQRLAIARALVADPPLLVLDESTSALDLKTEQRVVDAIAADRSRSGRTTIVIAHRASACVHADRWLALAGGRVTAQGAGAPDAAALTTAGRT